MREKKCAIDGINHLTRTRFHFIACSNFTINILIVCHNYLLNEEKQKTLCLVTQFYKRWNCVEGLPKPKRSTNDHMLDTKHMLM